MRYLLFIIAALIPVAVHAQDHGSRDMWAVVPEELADVGTWSLEEAYPDSAGAGWARFVTEEGDWAEVFYDTKQEPSMWKARIGEQRYAHSLIAGTFPVSDSLAFAYGVYKRDREKLEALELLETVERVMKRRVDDPSFYEAKKLEVDGEGGTPHR